jgi:hypothetical protein
MYINQHIFIYIYLYTDNFFYIHVYIGSPDKGGRNIREGTPRVALITYLYIHVHL